MTTTPMPAIGDRIIITPLNGNRFGLLVDVVNPALDAVCGQRFSVATGMPLPTRWSGRLANSVKGWVKA